MEKVIKWLGVASTGMLLALGIASTLVVPTMALDDEEIQPRSASDGARSEVQEHTPTFMAETVDEDSAKLWMGKNLLLAGNTVSTDEDIDTGLMFAAGNVLRITSNVEYGFVAGNTIDFTGSTERDLFAAGNTVTIAKGSHVGRDAFLTGNEIRVQADMVGDVSIASDTAVIDDVTISGNLNITASTIQFKGNVIVEGKLVYNDNAVVTGLDDVTARETEIFHVEEPDPLLVVVARVYNKIISMSALFLIMALIIALCPRLHKKIENEATVNRFGTDLAIGVGLLIVVPVIALISFFTFIAAPLGLIALLIYGIVIYLSQGFAGFWLGHVIVEKVFHSKGNAFLEALFGIIILGLCSLIPYLGIATGFLGLVLGMGIIAVSLKPTKEKTVAETSTEASGE